jgi:hypothetical protein
MSVLQVIEISRENRGLSALPAELPLVAFIGGAKRLFKNQLTNAHSRTKADGYFPVIHHLKAHAPVKPSMNCGVTCH